MLFSVGATDGWMFACALLYEYSSVAVSVTRALLTKLQEHALANKIGFSHSTIRAWETSAIFLGNTREYHIVFSTHEVRMRGLGRVGLGVRAAHARSPLARP
jgi:hypothetical protein